MASVACFQPDLDPDSEHRLLGDDGHIWHFNQTINADLANIASLGRHIQKFCIARCNADSAVPLLGQDMNLALSELLTNIVKHAYPPAQGGKIEVFARFVGQHLEVLIVDQGTELPDHVLEKRQIEFDGDDIIGIPEGGFGWSIVHSIIDHVVYQRVDDCNRLLLRKNVYFNLEAMA